mmetsp:Transcript_24425/g.53990  ORF Transcript_24425/g.53990 Transcript_24425/m.53990 type:complete len:95 (+) Transcript_24425:570-854(+)
MQSKSRQATVAPLAAAIAPYSTCSSRPSEENVVIDLSYLDGSVGLVLRVGLLLERAASAGFGRDASSNVSVTSRDMAVEYIWPSGHAPCPMRLS